MRRDASVLPKVSSNSGIFVAVALLFFFSTLTIRRHCATIFAGCHPCTLTEGHFCPVNGVMYGKLEHF